MRCSKLIPRLLVAATAVVAASVVCLAALGGPDEAERETAIEAVVRGIERRHQLLSHVELGYTEERYFNKNALTSELKSTLMQFRWLAYGGWCRAETRLLARDGERAVADDHYVMVISDGSTFLKYDPDARRVVIKDADAATDTGEGIAESVADVAGLIVPGRLGDETRKLGPFFAAAAQDTIDGVEAWKLSRREDDFVSAIWIAPTAGHLIIHSEGRRDRKMEQWVAKGWVVAVTATEQLPNGGIVPKEKKTVWYLVDAEGRRTWTWLYRHRLVHARTGEKQVLPDPMSLDWLPMGTRLVHPLWTETVGGEVDRELVKAIRDGAMPSDEEVWDGVEVRFADSAMP